MVKELTTRWRVILKSNISLLESKNCLSNDWILNVLENFLHLTFKLFFCLAVKRVRPFRKCCKFTDWTRGSYNRNNRQLFDIWRQYKDSNTSIINRLKFYKQSSKRKFQSKWIKGEVWYNSMIHIWKWTLYLIYHQIYNLAGPIVPLQKWFCHSVTLFVIQIKLYFV